MYLSVNSNPLKHIRELSSIVSLQRLYLSDTTIPSGIDKLQNLMELDDNLFSTDQIKTI